ncbi:13963_t:CDS:1 [Funneliformis caledonium]|uniref:13963_t:CDS:1 n=1 Tax=Funneliformis caledonium TaxID=1117310 RepID=A0A9N9CCJ3_9GLOM|nr:13963_t:CDS:1 [Funneliformis caledonium]
MNDYNTRLSSFKRKGSKLEERFEVLKDENNECLEDIINNISENDKDQCIANIGKLGNIMKNTYEMVGEQTELTKKAISVVKELTAVMTHTRTRLDQLEIKVNRTEFLSNYRDWIKRFIDKVKDKLGEKEWRLAESALFYLESGMELTDEELNCIENLKDFLRDVEMTIDDIKLLREMRDKSNALFHSNGQNLMEAQTQLNNPLPDDLKIYKIPLQKALEAINNWRTSRF